MQPTALVGGRTIAMHGRPRPTTWHTACQQMGAPTAAHSKRPGATPNPNHRVMRELIVRAAALGALRASKARRPGHGSNTVQEDDDKPTDYSRALCDRTGPPKSVHNAHTAMSVHNAHTACRRHTQQHYHSGQVQDCMCGTGIHPCIHPFQVTHPLHHAWGDRLQKPMLQAALAQQGTCPPCKHHMPKTHITCVCDFKTPHPTRVGW